MKLFRESIVLKEWGAKYTSLEALILGGSEKRGGNEEDWQVSE